MLYFEAEEKKEEQIENKGNRTEIYLDRSVNSLVRIFRIERN